MTIEPTDIPAVDEAPVPAPSPAAVQDEKLVAEAAEFIRKSFEEAYRGSLVTVGEYVLKNFFGGDAKLARSQDPNKNASFRALTEKCGTAQLPISKTWLNNAVGLVLMTKELPEEAKSFRQLPHTHQVVLLPLKDPAKVEKLAEKAVEKELTVRELKAEVATERVAVAAAGEGAKRGRPALPTLLKSIEQAQKALTFEGRRQPTKALIEELEADQAEDVLGIAEDLAERLALLIEKLKKLNG